MNEGMENLIEIEKYKQRIAELEQHLLLAYDTIRKGDLARQNAGGMEMRIQELEHENAELKAVNNHLHENLHLKIAAYTERDQLRLQVVRLREALTSCTTIIRDDAILRQQALAETPSQSAKEVLEQTIKLLDALRRIAWPTELVEKLEQEIQRLERLCK